jgi:hypothetical protein
MDVRLSPGYHRRLLWLMGALSVGLAGVSLMLRALAPTSTTAAGAVDPLTLAWSSSLTHNSRAAAWGDVDNDGDLDLAVGNATTPSRIYLNNDGVMALDPIWSSAIITSVASLAWGDVDGDGDLDLVTGLDCNPCNAIQLYRNNGGTLTTNPVYSSTLLSGAVRSVVLGDMDGDGDLDLAAGRYFAATLIYTNGGSGFSANPAITLTTSGGNTTALAWGDADADGDLDLAEGKYSGNLRVYRNTGVSLAAVPFYTSTSSIFVYGLAWGDADNNGYQDIATTGADLTRIFTNSASGLTAAPVFTSTDPGGQAIGWADFDNDGDLDLMASASLYRNNGITLTATAYWTSPVPETPAGIAWGDANNDGALDLAAVSAGAPARLYRNNGASLDANAFWTAALPDKNNRDLAWGDVDNDGDLDLAVGNFTDQINLYRNTAGALATTPFYTSTAFLQDRVSEIAWGDVDNDGDLDLAVGYGFSAGQNRVYTNTGTTLGLTPAWTSSDSNTTESVAWGDVDNDGDLDLMTGNDAAPNKLYRNNGGALTLTPVYSTTESDYTESVAWGDVDNDGDLDLAVGNGCSGFNTNCQPNKLYRNDGGTLTASAVWSSAETDWTQAVAWGDVDGDGDLDLAAANNGEPSRLYRNDNGTLTASAVWSTVEAGGVIELGWGDMDNDGDLDLVTGGPQEPVRIYRNDGGVLSSLAVWSSSIAESVSVALGDMDNDGDLDLAAGRSTNNVLYRNLRDGRTGPAPIPLVRVVRPSPPANADFYSAGRVNSAATIPITYTLSDPNSTAVRLLRAFYSPDGGGQWFPAVAATGTLTSNLSTSPGGVTRTFNWNVSASGFFGQSDNVVFRLQAVPTITLRADAVAGPYLYGSYASQTFPFRVRGTQIRVVTGTTTPVSSALVFRLPGGQSVGGAPLTDNSAVPFRTDAQGYLQGRGQVSVGDRLFAMLPITWTENYTLYHTSGTPTLNGVAAYTLTTAGVQTLTVSASRPLYLFNIKVALEWDASSDPTYLDQLVFNLQRASEYLYDFTNGQAALGEIYVTQNADDWGYANVVIHANNRLRPYAAQGGVVLTDTIDPQHSLAPDLIVYPPGQVHIGSTWNRYGQPGVSLGDDWPIILAHELGHYLFFHDDTYLGLNPAKELIPVSTCTGSAMGDIYNDPTATEFIAFEPYWQANCHDTLPEQTLERNEWETMKLWYPGFITPTTVLAGPTLMPFDFTNVQILNPITPTIALVDPTFYLNYVDGGGASSEARAFLLRTLGAFSYTVDLGAPFGGQNRVIARGAQAGDRLCVFDRPRSQYGCEVIEDGDDQVQLEKDLTWTPIVAVTPVNSTTLTIQVQGLTGSLALRARLFPEYGGATPIISLNASYTGTITLTYPTLAGHVQLWVNEAATETNPRREAMVAFSIGGNPGPIGSGVLRAGGGVLRAGGGVLRAGGGVLRAGGAPVVSPDGQMIFFTDNPLNFDPGEFYAIQAMAGLPSLPPGRTVIGQGYRLVATPGTPVISGSVSIQYLSNDVLVANADENQLTLYYNTGAPGAPWVELPTTRNPYFNVVSAPAQGEGIYALMSSIQIPLYKSGWNLFAYPLQASQPVSPALASITGKYELVYGYLVTDTLDPWKVFDPTPPVTWVNDLNALSFGNGYWISATQPVTIHLSPPSSLLPDPSTSGFAPLPPATFYGYVQTGNGFTPTVGMTVTASIGAVVCGQAVTVDAGSSQIGYAINVSDDNLLPGCGAAGQSVAFTVAGQPMSTMGLWDDNDLIRLDLLASNFNHRVFLPFIRR